MLRSCGLPLIVQTEVILRKGAGGSCNRVNAQIYSIETWQTLTAFTMSMLTLPTERYGAAIT